MKTKINSVSVSCTFKIWGRYSGIFILFNVFASIFSICALQLNVGVYRKDDGHLNGKLFFSHTLNFQCEIIHKGLNDTVNIRRALGTSFASQGLAPSITIYNSTWRKTIQFPGTTWDSDLAAWNLSLSRDAFSFTDGITEMWDAKVQLDSQTGLLQVQTVILDKTREPLLQMVFGSELQSPPVNLIDGSYVKLVPSPCSADVLVAAVTDTSLGIILMVSYDAFVPRRTTYWAISDMLCESTNIAGCTTFHLLDLVLTSRYLLFLTSGGLFKVDVSRYGSTASYVQTGPSSISDWTEYDLIYTPVSCKSERDLHDEYEELVFLQPKSGDAQFFWSVEPFSTWTKLDVGFSPTRISYEWQSRTLIVTYEQEGVVKASSYPVSILSSGSPLVPKSPAVAFPDDFHVSGICIHPMVAEVNLFGSQIWSSNDGGVSYNQVHGNVDIENDVINSCIMGVREKWILFITQSQKVLIKKEGVNRYTYLHLLSATNLSSVIFDSLGSLIEVFLLPSEEHPEPRPVYLQHIQESREGLLGMLSLQPLNHQSGILMEYISDTPALTNGMEGLFLINERLQIQLEIEELLQMNKGGMFLSSAKVKMHQFQRWATQIEDCDFVVHFDQDHTCILELTCPENYNWEWTTADIGKTVIVEQFTSFLLVEFINGTHLKAAPTFPAFLLGLERYIVQASRWMLLDFRMFADQLTPAETLVIDQTGSDTEAYLSQNSDLTLTSDLLGMSIMTSSASALIHEVKNESHMILSNVSGEFEDVLQSGEWIIANTTQGTQWNFQENHCRHVLEVDSAGMKYGTRYLDVGDSFSFIVTASTTDHSIQSGELLSVHVSNPKVLHLYTTSWRGRFGSEVMNITVTHRTFGKGSSSLTVSIPSASTLCPHSSHTILFHCTCPPSKHLHFVYEPQLSDDLLLHGNPVDHKKRPLLTNLVPNYRPPSHRGVDIPLSDNIYNGYPNRTRPRDYYTVSIKSGRYKQCAGKSTREECGCTDQMKLSSLAKDSDCRERVYRKIHPGKVTLNFTIREHGKGEVLVKEPLVILLKELNDREDYSSNDPTSPSIEEMKRELYPDADFKLYKSTSIKLTLKGSGLYHFQASILEGFSHCDLKDEFLFYVDLAPLPNTTITIVIAVVGVLMGTIIFVGYLNYLSTHPRPVIRRMLSKCTIEPKKI